MNKPFLKCLSLGLLMLLASYGWAQDAGSMPSRADLEQRVENTVDDLGLNAEQAEEFRKVELQFIDDRKSKMEAAGDQKKARQAIRALSDAKMEKMKTILTPEQFEIYKQLKPKRGADRRKGKRPRHDSDEGMN